MCLRMFIFLILMPNDQKKRRRKMRANIFFLIQLEGNENELFFFKYEIIVPNIH